MKRQPETDQARFIGVVKKIGEKKDGRTNATTITIIENGKRFKFSLSDADAELDFIRGKLPTGFRQATPEEAIELRPILMGEIKHSTNSIDLYGEKIYLHQVKFNEKSGEIKLPVKFAGIRADDQVAMCAGGIGDPVASAISWRLQNLGGSGKMFQINAQTLLDNREASDSQKDDDDLLLAILIKTKPELFRPVGPKEREVIKIGEKLRDREVVRKQLQATVQRLGSRANNRALLEDNDTRLASLTIAETRELLIEGDPLVQMLKKELDIREAELRKIVHTHPVWKEILSPIKGCGERIAAGLISNIVSVSRFPTRPKLTAFCGVHVGEDGKLPRHRKGKKSNWVPDARQALWLLADQIGKFRGTYWNDRLLDYKEKIKLAHPEVVEIPKTNSKGRLVKEKLYTPGHILDMAKWKMLNKFVCWLYKEWKKLEKRQQIARD
jgi:hypothetical protein